MHRTHQEPLGSYLGMTSETELPEPKCMLDLTDRGFNDRLAPGVKPSAFESPDFTSHALPACETLRYPATRRRFVSPAMRVSTARDVDIDLSSAQVNEVLFGRISRFSREDLWFSGEPGDHVPRLRCIGRAIIDVGCNNYLMSNYAQILASGRRESIADRVRCSMQGSDRSSQRIS
jgi:hypothetical protein